MTQSIQARQEFYSNSRVLVYMVQMRLEIP